MLLKSVDGDIINQAQLTIDKDGNDQLVSQGTIKSGGAMLLSANTITNDGSTLESADNLYLKAKEDVNLNSLVMTELDFNGEANNHNFSMDQSLVKSSTTVGGHLMLDVGGDMNVVGSDLSVTQGTQEPLVVI